MNSWLDLEGKSIIVTGAASGIGLACAQELLNDGANQGETSSLSSKQR